MRETRHSSLVQLFLSLHGGNLQQFSGDSTDVRFCHGNTAKLRIGRALVSLTVFRGPCINKGIHSRSVHGL